MKSEIAQPKLEILYVSHKYPPATGGMEQQSFALIQGTARFTKVHTLLYEQQYSRVRFFLSLNKRIKKIIKENPNIRLIHFNDGLIAAVASYQKSYTHLKRVLTLHGLDITFPLPYFQKKIIPRLNSYDKIIAVSRATADAAILRGIHADKIVVINNGVDAGTAESKEADFAVNIPRAAKVKPYFVMLGRPVKRKGFSWFLQEVLPKLQGNFQVIMVGPFNWKTTLFDRILSILPGKIQHYLTLFLGYPTDQAALRKLLPQYGDRVRHLGKLPLKDLKIVLQQASAFLMPNIPVNGDMEGFGLVCLEASLAGSLVVASDLEGITNAIHHQKNGILLPACDSACWAAKLQSVLDRPRFYKKQAKKFQQYSQQHYSWERMASEYMHLFESLLQCNAGDTGQNGMR